MIRLSHDALAALMRERLHEAMLAVMSADPQPYGMTGPEANAAMLDGAVLALADFAHAAASPNAASRALVADYAARRLVSQVAARDTAGSA